MIHLLHFLIPHPILADTSTIIMYVIEAVALAVSYVGYEKAKKSAQDALNRAKGLLYQSRATTEPRRILYGRRRIGGLEVYVQSSGENNNYLNYVLVWCDGPCQGVEKILFDGADINVTYDVDGLGSASGKYSGLVKVQNRLGGSDNDIPITNMSFPHWGSNDLLLGICYTALRLFYDDKVFSGGLPNVSAVIQGKNDVYDPRDDTHKYTDNPVLCLNDYLTTSRLGPGIDYVTRVSADEFLDAANVSDEDVPLSVGGTQKRYTFNEVLTLDQDPETIIEIFRTAFAGVAVYIGGKWRYYAGHYVTPTLRITKDDLVAPVSEQTKVGKSQHVNTVKGSYVAECNNWQPTSFPTYTKTAYVTEDKEELLEMLDYTSKNNVMECRRMASIELARQRLSRSASISCTIRALRAQPGLPIIFHFPELGYDEQPMMVLEMGASIGAACTIGLNLREYGPEIFDWDPAEDAYATAYCPDMTGMIAPGPPPGSPKGGDGPTYTDRHPDIVDMTGSATISVVCKTQGGTASLVGKREYVDADGVITLGVAASSPPKKYRHLSISGGPFVYEGSIGACGHCGYEYSDAIFSGSCIYDQFTGTATDTTSALNHFDGTSACSHTAGPSTRSGLSLPTDGVAYGSADNQFANYVQSTTRVIGKAAIGFEGCRLCHDFSGTPGYCNASGEITFALSEEDTEEDAIARLEATFADWSTITGGSVGSSCVANYSARTTGFDISYTKARVFVTGSGYFALWTYAIRFDVMRRASGTADPFLKVAEIDVELPADGTGAIDTYFDVPQERGFETYVTGGTVET